MTYYFFLNCKHNCPFEEENVEINLLLTCGLASKKFFFSTQTLRISFSIVGKAQYSLSPLQFFSSMFS